MKIAVCVSGYLGINTNGSTRTGRMIHNDINNSFMCNEYKNKIFSNPISGYNNLKKILNNNQFDIFIHSWNINKINLINNTYKPKKFKYEKQRNFNIILEKYNIENNLNPLNWKISNNAKIGYKILFDYRKQKKSWDKNKIMKELQIEAFRTSSRLYSLGKSIELKTQYEKENNFKYDFVICCRFDNNKNFNYDYDFNKLNQKFFYAESRKHRIDGNYTLNDLWFISNSNNINILGKLYENRFKYCIRQPFSIREYMEEKIGKEFIKLI